MNKEYDRNNTGSLWVADKKTIKGETYYNGTLTIDNKDYSVTMFKNNSDNPKAPTFRLKVNAPREESIENYVVTENQTIALANKYGAKVEKKEDAPFIDFGDTVELTDNDIDLAF